MDSIKLQTVIVEDRIRKDFGDIDGLASSISEYGLIEPLVIARDLRLIAGERRLRALRRLNTSELIHGKDFIWNDEVDPLRRVAMEIEENVKRKELSWQEQVLGKARLLEVMQAIQGTPTGGRPSLDPQSQGFGVNKLAAMLGESSANTSRDLELARLISVAPQLAKAETKDAARKQAQVAILVAGGLAAQQKASASGQQPVANWILYEGDFQQNAHHVLDSSVDLVIVDPPYGEDVSGMAANSRNILAPTFVDSLEPTVKLYQSMCKEAFRVLREDRFAAFFFGFSVYSDLVSACRYEGFSVDVTPLVWVKNTVINTSPYTRYGRSYEPILIARKGEPKLVRPSQRDVLTFDTIISRSQTEIKTYHAQKPVQLIEKFVLDMTVEGSIVVDFCAGSGTAGEAALRNRRKVVLFERDATACQIIRARLGGIK